MTRFVTLLSIFLTLVAADASARDLGDGVARPAKTETPNGALGLDLGSTR